MNYYRNVPEQDMKKYTRSRITSQALPPIQEAIYTKALENINKKRKEQVLLTRKQIKTLIYKGYTEDSISNALNALSDLALMFYDRITRSWLLVLKNLKSIDIQGAYQDWKQDLKSTAINTNIYLFGIYESRRIIGGTQ